jgi:DNA-directed RNA polymerase subunit RPC12/RpoP
MISFKCNLCGRENALPRHLKHRELLNCSNCGSSARVRGVIYALQREILRDTQTSLRDVSPRKHLRGIGMSDWTGYACDLERIFDYTNTFYHQEPRLDVTSNESVTKYENLDFVISSDVLEHVAAPVSRALLNIRGMLNESGLFILTAPYLEGYETIEHFPHLYDFKITQCNESYRLENKRADGYIETFDSLIFHGGPGSVLEMRIFGEGDLFNLLKYAGFSCEVLEPSMEGLGYLWDDCVENQLHRNRRNKSYVLLCRPR